MTGTKEAREAATDLSVWLERFRAATHAAGVREGIRLAKELAKNHRVAADEQSAAEREAGEHRLSDMSFCRSCALEDLIAAIDALEAGE